MSVMGGIMRFSPAAPGPIGGTTPADSVRAHQFIAPGETVTASKPVLDLAQTWNNGAAVFTGRRLNITDTASDATSRAEEWQLNGVTRAYLKKSGQYVSTRPGQTTLTVGTSESFARGDIFTDVGYLFIQGASSGTLTVGVGAVPAAFSGWSINANQLLPHRAGSDIIACKGLYTDASNYEQGRIYATAGSRITFAAETAGTGADDLDVELLPAGAGKVRFGAHSAVGAETVTGYITIKDAAGNPRKIAVLS